MKFRGAQKGPNGEKALRAHPRNRATGRPGPPKAVRGRFREVRVWQRFPQNRRNAPGGQKKKKVRFWRSKRAPGWAPRPPRTGGAQNDNCRWRSRAPRGFPRRPAMRFSVPEWIRNVAPGPPKPSPNRSKYRNNIINCYIDSNININIRINIL